MIKIFIGKNPLFLSDFDTKEKCADYPAVEYRGNKSELLKYIELFEADNFDLEGLNIYALNFEKLKADFFSFYKILEAAGGLVFNENNEILAIQRLGFWDLPKGKIEQGETAEEAAMREVMEETGIKNLRIKEFLTETFHTYIEPKKNRRIFKKSIWFEMETLKQPIKGQEEEGIEDAIWLRVDELKQKKPIYDNILEILNHCTDKR